MANQAAMKKKSSVRIGITRLLLLVVGSSIVFQTALAAISGHKGSDDAWIHVEPTSIHTVSLEPIRVPRDYATIQSAIDAAVAGQEIWVNQGTYPEQIRLKSNIGVYGGFTGNETRRDQRDPITHETLIMPLIDPAKTPPDGTYSQKIITMERITNATLDGFKITAHTPLMNYDVFRSLICIYAHEIDSLCSISNCTITNCDASPEGYNGYVYGMYIDHSSVLVSICDIINNQLPHLSFCEMKIANHSDMDIMSCTFTNNKEGNVDVESSKARFRDCKFLNRLYGENSTWASIVKFTNCKFRANGGAVWARYSTLIMENCDISDSSHELALHAEESTTTLIACIVEHNFGGGIYEYLSRSSSITNCLIAGNHTYGVLLRGSKGSNTITNCTITSNTTGIEADAPIRIVNTIISHATTGISASGSGDQMSLINNLFFRNTGGDYSSYRIYHPEDHFQRLTDAGQINVLVPNATGNVSGDPMFVDVANGNYHLRNGSAALDHALSADAPDTDLEGNSRPGSDVKCDIGAYESDASFIPQIPVLKPKSLVSSVPFYTTSSLVAVPFVAWHPAGALCNIVEVRLYYRKDGGNWMRYQDGFGLDPASINFDTRLTGGDGSYDFYTCAIDDLGNVEDAPANPDATILIISNTTRSRVYINKTSAGPQTGADWAHGIRELSTGLEIAKIEKAGEIWIATGNFYLGDFTPYSGLKLYGGFKGNETNLAQRYCNDNPTTVVTALTYDSIHNTVLDGFTIQSSYYSSKALISCTNLDGSCLFKSIRVCMGPVEARNSTVSFLDSCFEKNYYAAFQSYNSRITLQNCNFTDPVYTKNVIYSENSELTLDKVVLSDIVNTFGYGSAIFSSNSNIRMTRCIIRRCRAGQSKYNFNGRAYQGENLAPPAPYELPMTYPPTPIPPDPVKGSGIYARGGTVNIESSVICNNSASPVDNFYVSGAGGGSYMIWYYPANLAIGGCIFVEDGSLRCTGSTFHDNRIYRPADHNGFTLGGSAICGVRSDVAVFNSVFTSNTLTAVSLNTGTLALDHCLFFNNGDGDYTGSSNRGNVLKTDPMYVNPAVGDYHLKSGSPAIDSGLWLSSPIVDLDGLPRGVTGNPNSSTNNPCYDLGAFEYQPAPVNIAVIYPDGGEKLVAGKPISIAWWINRQTAGNSLRLELWNKTNKIADLGVVSNPQGYGISLFTISSFIRGTDFRIRAESASNSAYKDFSDETFSIAGSAGIRENWSHYK